MEKATHDFLRESVEGALTRRLQGIDDDFEVARAQGMSNTTLREELVKDIDYLRTLVPQYTRRLNRRVSPLLRLPPEIFPDILCAAAPEREELISWLHLGHICHDLRSALLGLHALWADVVFDSDFGHVREELLERAGHCPIRISIIYEDADSKLFSAALRLLHDARSIDIQSEFPEQMNRIVQELEHGIYPSLEELRVWLDAPPISSAESSLIWSSQPMIMAPKLRSLDLRNILLHVDLSSLRSLSLTLYSDAPIQDADTFITMLRHCITLEHLEIDRWIPDCTTLQNQPPVQPVLSLPHLMHLKMEQDPTRILQFWSLLSIPTSASIDISFNEDFHDLQGSLERARTMRAFVAHALIDGATKITKLALDFRQHMNGFKFTLGSIHDSPQSSLWDPKEAFAFNFTLKTDVTTSNDLMTLLGCIFLSLQLHVGEIETLTCNLGGFDPVIDEDNAGDDYFFAIFAGITTLHAQELDSDIAYMLVAVSPCGRLRYFPRLQALQLGLRMWESSMMMRLVAALKIRAELGAPLRSVMLDDSGSYLTGEEMAQYLQELRTIVQYVGTYELRQS